MDTITLKGKPVNLHDELPSVGKIAEDFTFVKTNLSEDSLYDHEGVKVIIAVPSLDTSVCAMETKKFNLELGKRKGVTGFVVSMDLPFAMRRFCETEGIENVISASDFRYSEFAEEYNIKMIDGAMKGLLARAVLVIDSKNVIKYSELVPELVDEPDYKSALKMVDALLA